MSIYSKWNVELEVRRLVADEQLKEKPKGIQYTKDELKKLSEIDWHIAQGDITV